MLKLENVLTTDHCHEEKRSLLQLITTIIFYFTKCPCLESSKKYYLSRFLSQPIVLIKRYLTIVISLKSCCFFFLKKNVIKKDVRPFYLTNFMNFLVLKLLTF